MRFTCAMKTKMSLILTHKLALLLGISCAALLVSTNEAKAIRVVMPPNVSLAIGDAHELGTVDPATPQGDADITQYVNFMIGLSLGDSGHVIIGSHDNLVTRSMNDFGALSSPAVLALRGTGMSIDLAAQGTYDYLFAHYGGPGGGFSEVWNVADLTVTITIPSSALGHGLSGWALFTSPNGAVPDGGATVMLLGAALGALGV